MKTLAIRSDFDFQLSGFGVLRFVFFLVWGFWGLRVLGFGGFRVFEASLFWKANILNPTKGFEHVEGYAGFAAGKPRVCTGLVL